MLTKRRSIFVALLLITVAGTAFAQRRKQADSDIAVAKDLALYQDAMFTTIQAAVNAAKPGQVIEILDESVYTEQVTIDGRDVSPWAGVTAGKNGITLRYYSPPNAGWNHPRPTIKYKDTNNTHPKTKAEAQSDNEVTGAGNFETCGALRILRAKGITIEGIAVDGGGAYAFGAAAIWCATNGMDCSSLFHGNAAITVVVSGDVTIRDCDVKNAYFGVYLKDRNIGGVFGNPNPADYDVTVPLSKFGNTGGHLLEYNRVNGNVAGIFFESSWDLGSTVRYNLIYNNKVNKSLVANLPEYSNQNGGAFMFKDTYLSPVAIYNNTLYDNTGNFCGNWQTGGQHLIFNNIFSKSTPSQNPGNAHMSLDAKFPFRMNNNVFSADSSRIRIQCQTDFNCDANSEITPGGCFVSDINGTSGDFVVIQGTSQRISDCIGRTSNIYLVRPGILISTVRDPNSTATITIPATSNLRWLQTEGINKMQPSLFKSLSPTSADFLVPDWDYTLVKQYIKNQGWADAGIRNTDGTIADLGAIPSTGVRQTTVAQIIPTDVVLLTGTAANAKFSLKIANGTMNDPKIKMLRWIAPIPDNKQSTGESGGDWPSRMKIVPANAIANINSTSDVKIGSNALSITLPKAMGVADKYGFFEIIAEGTDANGITVTSDVGFLPYRQLEYFFKIEVLDAAGTVTSTVRVGEKYSLRVSALKGTANFTSEISEVSYNLLSDPTALMYTDPELQNPLISDKHVIFPKTYPSVYFTRAGKSETISASGFFASGDNRFSILGTADIVVNPAPPANVTFISPISKSMLGSAAPPAITRGEDFLGRVQVRDKFGNPVSTSVPVSFTSDKPAIGVVGAPNDISSKIVDCDPSTGIADFTARAIGGVFGDVFDITASISGGSSDVARLKVFDSRLLVFYGDTASGKNWNDYYDGFLGIQGKSGEWYKVTVKAVNIDSVITNYNGYVAVKPTDPGLLLRADPDSGGASVFPLKNGEASFWVGAAGIAANISNACLDVQALRTDSYSDADGSIAAGNRCNIKISSLTSPVSVKGTDRVVPPVSAKSEAAVAPVSPLTYAFTAGPNPASARPSGVIGFFYNGGAIKSGTLSVYDAVGNKVSKISINTKNRSTSVSSTKEKRQIGSWDLTDKKGRPMPYGTYLVRGVLKTSSGKSEKVSVVVGVR
jgi:hypothetical protein